MYQKKFEPETLAVRYQGKTEINPTSFRVPEVDRHVKEIGFFPPQTKRSKKISSLTSSLHQ